MPKFSFDPKITLGNIITIVLALIPAIYAYAVMAGTVSQSAEAVKAIPTIEKRLTTVEINQVNGRNDRIDFQDKTEATLEKLANQQALIMAQLAGIIARMDEAEKRR